MATENLRFHWSDYLVFILSLVLSGSVGIIQGIVDTVRNRKNKNADIGTRNISVWPASLSVMASCLAAPFVLGVPAEIYAFGTEFAAIVLGYLIGVPIITHFFFKRFYEMEITSIYEYLEFRFSKTVRSLCTFIFAFTIIIYMGIITYAPAVAFSQVTGLSMAVSILGVGIIGTFYTAIGGLKGVIWVDAIQMVIILISMLIIIIKGSVDVGGLSEVFRKAHEGGRLRGVSFSLNPLVRHTFWTQAIGGTVLLMIMFTNQSIVQKFLGLPTIKTMNITSYVSMAALVIYLLLFTFAGLVMYAYYAGCSPLITGVVKNADQLIPVFVLELFQGIYGIAGLFTAAVFSASLSSFAGGINALAAVTILDVINPLYTKRTGERQINPRKMVFIFKGLVVFYGLITIGFAYLAPFLGTGLLQLAMNLMGVVGAPMLALFIMGIFMPCVNSLGAFVGLLVSLVVMLWISTGGIFMAGKYKFHLNTLLSLTKVNCPKAATSLLMGNSSNATWTYATTSVLLSNDMTTDGPFSDLSQLNVTSAWMMNNSDIANQTYLNATKIVPSPSGVEMFYMMSYMWYSVLAVVIAVVVAVLVSWCSGFQNGTPIDPSLAYVCCYKEAEEEELFEEKMHHDKVPLNGNGVTIEPICQDVKTTPIQPSPDEINEIPKPFEEYDDNGVYDYGIFRRDRCSRCRRSKIIYCTKF